MDMPGYFGCFFFFQYFKKGNYGVEKGLFVSDGVEHLAGKGGEGGVTQ